MKDIQNLIIKTYNAAADLRRTSDRQIKAALKTLADLLLQSSKALLAANAKDLARHGADNPQNDRLMLNEQRIRNIANSIRNISKLPNPAGIELQSSVLQNGLLLQKITTPLGVAGVVYESRPNVTFDIAALCLRSHNGCLLKGSSNAEETNRAAIKIIHRALKQHAINAGCITLLPARREVVNQLFTATRYVDVIIPRGSQSLIQYVRQNSLVPVIETGAGVCHIYVETDADISKAVNIVVNAKVSRPSVCNAVDTILADEAIAATFLSRLATGLQKYGVEIFAGPKAYRMLKGYPALHKATPAHFGREFLSLACAVQVVKNIDGALQHIQQYSTRHSEAIISKNKKQCERFLHEVDAAVVYANASTRFTDGEEFGLGAEIGISTQKLHARGPFALEKLVTEKWVVRGSGQVRN